MTNLVTPAPTSLCPAHISARAAALQPLSTALRTATAAAHEQAEHSLFMDNLIGGKLNAAAFIALQEQSLLFYRALEQAGRAVAADPRTGGLCDPALERVPSLEADLDLLHGSQEWRDQLTALPATAAYVARLEEIAASANAPQLVAHHYVRYLGDLSGGQVIARMMQRHYGVAPEALSFYRFADIAKLKPYKDQYRAKLDALPLEPADREELLAEASAAFRHNMAVFADLGRSYS